MLCERRDLDRIVHSEGTLWAVVSVVAVFLDSSHCSLWWGWQSCWCCKKI